MKFYLTFGQNHVHNFKGKKLDRDIVAVINAKTQEGMRDFVLKHFKEDWFFIYNEEYVDDLFLSHFSEVFTLVNKKNEI